MISPHENPSRKCSVENKTIAVSTNTRKRTKADKIEMQYNRDKVC